jgi:1,4-dihydroxy-2-naphthoyl-CoA synthase
MMQSSVGASSEITALPDLEGLEQLSLSTNIENALSGVDDIRVGIDRTEAVAVVQLNRPAKRNALTQGMMDRLVAVLGQLDQDNAVRAVVLMGTRKGAFSGQSPRCY